LWFAQPVCRFLSSTKATGKTGSSSGNRASPVAGYGEPAHARSLKGWEAARPHIWVDAVLARAVARTPQPGRDGFDHDGPAVSG
jgi:hypothetical protein